jgi:nucleoside 2-deoxyribosyltransferase
MSAGENSLLTIVGGVYREQCMHPSWQEIYGSGGRAASAIARMGGQVELYAYLDIQNREALESRSALENFLLHPTIIDEGAGFNYYHGLDSPSIYRTSKTFSSLNICANKVIRFGLIEGDAIVDAEYAVYDPQNVFEPAAFHANGSKATHLALVLNRYEAGVMTGEPNACVEDMARMLVDQDKDKDKVEVVVIKMGPFGALVYDKGVVATVPAYHTDNVWKIGSGDTFVAHFGYRWMHEGFSAVEAATLASKATAFYCESRGFPTQKNLVNFNPEPIHPSLRFTAGYKPMVYLAGPFFTLAQLWLIEQARDDLRDMGLRVFSPYHDVGHGSADDVVQKDLSGIDTCDIVFAIGDGLDSGTVFEIGHARAKGKVVIMYSENVSVGDKKMMEGSGCILCKDYVTSIYKTLWVAASL